MRNEEINVSNVFTVANGTLTGNPRYYYANYKSRIATPSKIISDRDYILKNVNTAFRCNIYFYDSDGNQISENYIYNGGYALIKKGSIFMFAILRSTGDVDGEVANIKEFASSINVISSIQQDIKNLSDKLLTDIEWYDKYGIYNDNGLNVADDTKVCSNYIYCPNGYVVIIDVPAGYISRIYIYDANKEYIINGFSRDWKERHNYKLKLNNQYCRISVAKSDYSVIDYSVTKKCKISVDDYTNSLNSLKIKDYIMSKNALPSYWSNYLDVKIDTINTRLNGITNYDQFVFITDLHINQGNSGRYGDIIDYLIKNTSIDKVICGGDIFTGLDELKPRHGEDLLMECGFKLSRNPYVKYLYTLGNHDNGIIYDENGLKKYAIIDSVFDIYRAVQMEENSGIVSDSTTPSRFYYVDYNKKTFYIFLDNSMPDTTLESYSTSKINNNNFLCNVLLNMVPTDFTVVIITHIIWINEKSEYTYDNSDGMAQSIMQIANAYNNRTSVLVNSNTFNFNSAKGNIALIQCGHLHLDVDINYNGIPVVGTTCDSWKQAYPIGNNGRSEGNTTENAFDVVTIDKDNKKIYHDRIGYGNSREFVFI